MSALLLPVTIGAAINPLVRGPIWQFQDSGPRNLAIEALFARAGGGTTVDAYVQTSFDALTWFDIANFHFTTATAARAINLSSLTPVTAAITPASGVLTANTCVDGMIGDFLSILYGSSGTYTGATTLALYASTARLREAQ